MKTIVNKHFKPFSYPYTYILRHKYIYYIFLYIALSLYRSIEKRQTGDRTETECDKQTNEQQRTN